MCRVEQLVCSRLVLANNKHIFVVEEIRPIIRIQLAYYTCRAVIINKVTLKCHVDACVLVGETTNVRVENKSTEIRKVLQAACKDTSRSTKYSVS